MEEKNKEEVQVKTTVTKDGESKEFDCLYYKGTAIEEAVIDGDKLIIKLLPKNMPDVEMHADFFPYVVVNQPLNGYAFYMAESILILEKLLDILRKYEYPIDKMSWVVKQFNKSMETSQDKAFEIKFGVPRSELTINIVEDVLKGSVVDNEENEE